MARRSALYVAAGFAVLAVAFALRYEYGILAKPMASELSLSNEQVGLVASSYFAVYAASTLAAGYLADAVGVKATVSGFLAVMGAGALLMSGCASFYGCAASYAVVGAGSGASWAPMASLIRRSLPESRRGLALGIIDSGSSLGFFTASLLVPLVLGRNWRAGWLIWGLSALAVAALVAAVMPGVKRGRLRPRLSGGLALLAVSYAFFGAALAIPMTFMVKYGAEEAGLSYSFAALLMAAIAAFSIPGKILLPHLSDRRGRLGVLAASLLLLAAGTGLSAAARSPALLFLLSAVIGVGYGGTIPIFAALAADSSDMAGTVLGAWSVLFSLGYAASSWAGGRLADVSGSYSPSFIVASAMSLTAAALVLLSSKAFSRAR